MKTLANTLAAAGLACALAAGPAAAQPGPPAHGQGQGARDYRGPPPGQDMQRGGRPDAPRREDYRQRESERRQQWMTPDDRRDLRRDIRDHGRDVYAPGRGR
jgi:hypothetical protein